MRGDARPATVQTPTRAHAAYQLALPTSGGPGQPTGYVDQTIFTMPTRSSECNNSLTRALAIQTVSHAARQLQAPVLMIGRVRARTQHGQYSSQLQRMLRENTRTSKG